MDIKDRVKMGGHDVKVGFRTTKEIDTAGEFNRYHQTIRLRKESDVPEDAIAEAYMHEIFEGIKCFNNLSLSHTDLTVLSEGFFQVIRDNDLDFRKPSETGKIKP